MAVERHDRDLKEAANRGLFFCEDSARRALLVFGYLKHSKGEWAGQTVVLAPWQAWNIACVFGWKHEDTGKRRFRSVYEEVGRKNGKTTKLAGIGIIGLCKDDEGGPEIYAAATKREQSRILFDEVCRMIKQSPPLRRRLEVQQHRILNPSNFGKFEPLSADGSTMDGLNPHMPLVDELHAHKTSEVWDVLRSALGARSQPLMWTITTAGFNKNGICYEVRDYAIKVLSEVIDDDSFFANIYTIDEGDDWQDESCWVKANPNLGVSVSLDYLREMARQAALMPQAKVNFLTKHLNVWVTGDALWCNIERWKLCAAEYGIADLTKAVRVHLAIDLSTVSDLTSIGGVAVFEDGSWKVFSKSYLPEDAVNNGMRKTTVPFKQWEEQGWLTLTPGNVVDYTWIERDVEALMELLPVEDVAFDRWNSSQLVNNLTEKDVPMVAFGQGYASMNAPMKEIERRYLSRQLEHNDNPVLNWAMSNLVADQDPAGNIKPAKNKSSEKIDPAVAVIMAAGRAMAVDDEPEATPELIIL
ncbi:terminase large subunit [Methylophaga lonarensis]|uniref:terminase large subunit n=1 Tax=Methylophaga lonarensis TaxID=999151 RepID=UPI003D2CD863